MSKELYLHLTGQRVSELGDLTQKIYIAHVLEGAPHKTATTAIVIQKYGQREVERDWISSGAVPTSVH